MTQIPSEEDITAICAGHADAPDALLEIFHDIQLQFGAVREADLHVIAQRLNRSRAEIYGVLSFYHDYRREPAGPVVVKLCRAEACQSVGALALIEEICAARGAALGETANGVTLEPVYCLGNCALGPAALVNDRLIGRLTPARLDAAIAEAQA
ncbi:NAD(P)H-dependent oxidoreductase subunit E [Paracoccaceae bacterium GXU_MW_L88]